MTTIFAPVSTARNTAPPRRTQPWLGIAAVTSVLFFGAIFGFFYAWVCSTMWGLDTLDPRTAIESMNAMNGIVRNAAFFPIFFLPPVVAAIAGALAWRNGSRFSAWLFGAAALIYAIGGIALTGTVNIPMNEALLAAPIPTDLAEANRVWRDYSSTWQVFNLLRTIASGLALALAAGALLAFGVQRSNPR